MADSCHFRTMHRGAAETPHLAQDDVVLDASSDTHSPPSALSAVPDTAATEDQRSLPGPLGQSSISLLPPIHPFSFLVPRRKVRNMQPIFQILNYTIVCLQAKVMTGVQEPDHSKRNELVKIHPDSHYHPYTGTTAAASIPKDMWINHWQHMRGRKIQIPITL